LILATVGAFGVFAYTVEERRREIGVRMALGAGARQVVATVIAGARTPILLGLGAGLLLAFAAAPVLGRFLYGLSPFDPIAYAGVSAILVASALVATWIPARRAARIDPAITLRGD
jgi:ABC-type antimicrobial peptide transport system permease subunit